MDEYSDSIQQSGMALTEQVAETSAAPDYINALITGGMITIGVILTVIIIMVYLREYKSKQLLNYVPTVWTSLGILGTFVTIVLRLDGINDLNDVDVLVGNLVPAFWTSIIGIAAALISSIVIKYIYARDDDDEMLELAKASGVQYRGDGLSLSPELALLKIERHMVQGNNLLTKLCSSMDQLRKENSDAIEQNLQQLESLYDKIFEENRRQAESLTTQYLVSVNQLINDANSQIKDSTTQILTSHTSEIKQYFDNELSKLQELSDQIKDIIRSIPAEIETTRSELVEELRQTIVDNYQILVEANTALTNELLERVRQFESALSQQSQTDYSSMIDHLNSRIANNITSLQDSLKTQEKAFREATEGLTSSMSLANQALTQSSKDYASIVSQVNLLLTQLSSYTAQTEQLLNQGTSSSQQMTELLESVKQILEKNQQLRYELMQWKRVHKKVVINDKDGTKICPNCGHENPMEANFCKKCAYGFWDCETIGSQLSKSK